MWFKRHLPFLRQVFLLAFTAFGGPQGHLVMMKRLFVDGRKDISDEELLDFNSFTQLLPGPSSSQTIMLVGLKRGGNLLGILTMLVWTIPACIIMGILSFVVYYLGVNHERALSIFNLLQPISIGFICYAAYLYTRQFVTNTATRIIAILSAVASITFLLPWTFPVLIVLGGVITTLSSQRIPDTSPSKRKSIQWRTLYIFLGVFLLLVLLARIAISMQWQSRGYFVLAENFYRFGSIVFGGGQVLLPMMLYQFVYRPRFEGLSAIISSSQLLTGYSLVQSIPGPVFSLAAYVGGIIMASQGPWAQVLGILIGSIFIFLPGVLLILFLFPIYQNLKYHVLIFRALEGIRAVITGILWGSAAIIAKKTIYEPYLHQDLSITEGVMYVILSVLSYILLRYKILSPQFIVVLALLLGTAMYFLPI